MNVKISSLAKTDVCILVSSLFVVVLYCFFRPLVLSLDSTYGFLAFKESLQFHSFNVISEISPGNINHIDNSFVSWWSPGQWLVPGAINFLFGTKLGIASIIVTIGFMVSGYWGYYRVFRFFAFPPVICILSLLILFSSSTLYYSFIIYQGGEILEFGVFPWFLLYVLRLKKVRVADLFIITSLFLLCFLAKTTLVPYCCLVLAYKIFHPEYFKTSWRTPYARRNLLLVLPIACSLTLIWNFFLSKGLRPLFFYHFGVSPQTLIIPVSAPLTSILSIQQWISRADKLIQTHFQSGSLMPVFVYSLLCIVFLFAAWSIWRLNQIDREYKQLFFFLYLGLTTFFIFAYSFNANIDYGSRHFKLLGYLFVPGLLSIMSYRIRSGYLNVAILGFCLIALLDILYLKHKWTANRYVGISYFYRNLDNLNDLDQLDQVSYRKLIDLDRRMYGKEDRSVLFFVESNIDVGIDIRHACALLKPSENILAKSFYGNGPVIVICISNKTLDKYYNILKRKFPDYDNFQLVDYTVTYRFFLARGVDSSKRDNLRSVTFGHEVKDLPEMALSSNPSEIP